MIVINRGYGVGEYKFNYCLIDETNEYLIENHLICIECNTDLPHDKLIVLYKKILLSLNEKRTLEFIAIYFGNNAINTTELNNNLNKESSADSVRKALFEGEDVVIDKNSDHGLARLQK